MKGDELLVERVTISESLNFSRIIMGMLYLPQFQPTIEGAQRQLEQIIALGVTTFDHADYYSEYESETLFGRILSRNKSIRDKIQIITKCGNIQYGNGKQGGFPICYNTSYKQIKESVESSLKRLQTEYIDMLLLHRIDHLADPREIAQAFQELKQEGKVRCFGVSNYEPIHVEALKKFYKELLVNELEFSACELKNFENGSAFYAGANNMKLLAYSPVGGGALFESCEKRIVKLRQVMIEIKEKNHISTIEHIAYAFLLRHPTGILPIVGSRKLSRLKIAVEALDIQLSYKDWYAIYAAGLGHRLE